MVASFFLLLVLLMLVFVTLNVFRAITVCQLELLHQTELKQQWCVANIESSS